MASTMSQEGESKTRKLKVLELYSGIGGMHWALEESGIPHEVVGAADINNVANDIYRHNFKDVKIYQKVIESFTVKDLEKISADMITMSPPCQPFTRVGLQKDNSDHRTKSFLHILDLLPQLSKIPSYILVENVKGFETSVTHQELLHTLMSCDYTVQEFLLTPNQFGVPNCRLRYYLLAKRPGINFNFPTIEGVREDLPDCIHPFLIHKIRPDSQGLTKGPLLKSQEKVNDDDLSHLRVTVNTEDDLSLGNPNGTAYGASTSNGDVSASFGCSSNLADKKTKPDDNIVLWQKYQSICRPVSSYLEECRNEETFLKKYLLGEKWFKNFWSMDIILEDAKSCCCFTKAYAHRIEGAGSILQTVPEATVNLSKYKEKRAADDTTHDAVRALGLRFFSPREIANLMCFPKQFNFPEELTTIQCNRVLGNSLNVHVVSILMRLLYFGDHHVWNSDR